MAYRILDIDTCRDRFESSGLFGANLESKDEIAGTIEWRDLVLIVEGIIEKPDSRKQRLEDLKNLRKR